MTPKQNVVVIDFGAQYAQLIARRVRQEHVFSHILPYEVSVDELTKYSPGAIILSGGPASVYVQDAPALNRDIIDFALDNHVPVLGICYGMQALTVCLGGEVEQTNVAEYGPAQLSKPTESTLIENTEQTVWMSHRDSVSTVPSGFVVTASTSTTKVTAIEDVNRQLFATQFHPEVHHTQFGQEIIRRFLFDVAKLEPSWSDESIIASTISEVQTQVGSDPIVLGLSGGVDSSVVAAILSKAVGKQLTCVFVDHGLLRQDEAAEVIATFGPESSFDLNFVCVDAKERYAKLLKGVIDPEEKRRRIGAEFWQIFFEEAEKVNRSLKMDPRLRGDDGGEGYADSIKYLAQGTIYPDVIESGARHAGKATSTIKSHHNLIPFPKGVHFELIEPLRLLFKDEVRQLGLALGLPERLVYRQPFPGPGLAVRIIGEVAPEKVTILQNADAIVRAEIDAYNEQLLQETDRHDSDRAVWQYFAVLPDIKSVGVKGDERSYEHPIIVRAVESKDAMTADWAHLPYEVLERISSRIVAEVTGVNRVAYDITSKPPGTIEWE